MGVVRVVLIALAVWFLIGVLRKITAMRRRGRVAGRDQSRIAERMVACAYCGTYVPVSDALARDGRYFCNREHARAGDAQP